MIIAAPPGVHRVAACHAGHDPAVNRETSQIRSRHFYLTIAQPEDAALRKEAGTVMRRDFASTARLSHNRESVTWGLLRHFVPR